MAPGRWAANNRRFEQCLPSGDISLPHGFHAEVSGKIRAAGTVCSLPDVWAGRIRQSAKEQ